MSETTALKHCETEKDSADNENDCEPPSRKISKLNFRWFEINTTLNTIEFVEEFNKNWNLEERSGDKFEVENLSLLKTPFKVCICHKFLSNPQLVKNLVDEMIVRDDWARKQMDLYEYRQIAQIDGNAECLYLNYFYDFLKLTVMPWMSNITGFKLNAISASCSMYNSGDYLLVHDDLLTTRKIAFVFYLTPWNGVEEWSEKMGGALELFNVDQNGLPKFPVVNKIFPSNNQFVFFHVTNNSFHQVGEVLTLDYPRLSINGWFHGEENDQTHRPLSQHHTYMSPHRDDVILIEWVQECYLHFMTKKQIQLHFENTSEISLEVFLINDFYQILETELSSNINLNWLEPAPANQSHYQILDKTNLRGPLNDLIKLFSSNEFFKLLYEYTELDLYGKNSEMPTCDVNIQKWTAGCYSILGDLSEYAENSLDIIMYFKPVDNIGITTYLLPEEEPISVSQNGSAINTDDDGDGDDDDVDVDEVIAPTIDKQENDSVLLTLYPKQNVLNLVYRSEGTARFTKYVPKAFIKPNEVVYMLVCNYRE